ncbi:unnamed protein product [Heligmosomoides polygyrus]|uniref:Tubulin-specific chaperone A n=1 Tax=Heligmosomoides polygyrus TaxID=6339 RepID=A0A183GUQ7_HELPZ|nr:unnamed protein product [Heligmosomoides polygyrus]
MKHHKLALKIATLKEEKEVVEAAVQKLAQEFDSLPEQVKTSELRICEDYIASTWDIVGEVEELIVAMEEMRIELQTSLEEESAKGKETLGCGLDPLSMCLLVSSCCCLPLHVDG